MFSLKHTKADGSVASTEYTPRGVEIELAACVKATRGRDDGLGTQLSGLVCYFSTDRLWEPGKTH
jgi:hypothetical protein